MGGGGGGGGTLYANTFDSNFLFPCQISAQMAEMKQLLMSSLSAMQTEIQTLKSEKARKRKVCTNRVAFRELSKGCHICEQENLWEGGAELIRVA